MSEITKFESDMSQTSKDIASQSWENLQTFEWWASLSPPPPNTQMSVQFCDLEKLYLC